LRNPFLSNFLTKLIRFGSLEVEAADGSVATYGDGTGRRARVKVMDRAAEWALMMNPALTLGELFVAGRIVVTNGDLYDALEIGARNLAEDCGPRWIKVIEKSRGWIRRFHLRNDRRRTKEYLARHYDLNANFYSLFLDADWQYSCAYFEHSNITLDEAQLAKKRHIAAKLLIEENQSVLDIGSGFGGMALYLAEVAGAKATGVTLSREQFTVATERAKEAGLAHSAHFALQDYRDVDAVFDRIVSVGMFEHVGLSGYDEFFQKVRRLLRDDGIMLLHAIGSSTKPNATNAWIRKYIFPGGYIPSLSEVMASIQRVGLLVTDIEILRVHYADTLRVWRERFVARRDEAKAMYDERFCRMWEFYLAGSETAFRVDGHMVFQIQLAKKQNVVPRTRDYIDEREARLREREAPKRGVLLESG
jgi:cyclopropane-fatty-acyl-phospholipid synthase